MFFPIKFLCEIIGYHLYSFGFSKVLSYETNAPTVHNSLGFLNPMVFGKASCEQQQAAAAQA
jgi:hypothetical protein